MVHFGKPDRAAMSAGNQPDFILLTRDLGLPIDVAPPWPPNVERIALEASDAAAIHALLRCAYANGFGGVTKDWLDWWEALVTDSEFDRDLCIVARTDGRIVGFCLCWTSSFVKDLVVAPEWQGRGLGTALLAMAITALRERGAAQLQLKVVTGNARAHRLYERMGFVA